MREKTISVVVIEPKRKPYTKEIENSLPSLQEEVDGYIEVIHPFPENVAIICDEEGKIKGKEFNRALQDKHRNIYDIIAGKFIIAEIKGDEFASLSKSNEKKFKEYYKYPQRFELIGGKIVVFQTDE